MTLDILLANLPSGWWKTSYPVESDELLSAFEVDTIAMRSATDSIDHGFLRVKHSGRWHYLYDDLGELAYYYLGSDIMEAAINLSIITDDWEFVNDCPSIPWFGEDMVAWLEKVAGL